MHQYVVRVVFLIRPFVYVRLRLLAGGLRARAILAAERLVRH